MGFFSLTAAKKTPLMGYLPLRGGPNIHTTIRPDDRMYPTRRWPRKPPLMGYPLLGGDSGIRPSIHPMIEFARLGGRNMIPLLLGCLPTQRTMSAHSLMECAATRICQWRHSYRPLSVVLREPKPFVMRCALTRSSPLTKRDLNIVIRNIVTV